MRRWSFALLAALLVLGAVEAMAWLTRFLIYGEDAGATDADRQAQTRLVPAFTFTNAGRAAHPFYGALVDWDSHDLNIAPPPQQRECALVVGLLGGSVAGDVSLDLERALFRHTVSLGAGYPVTWKTLAHGGWYQPQQLQALVNMLANGMRFHMVITLDGYNEVTRWSPMEGAFSHFPGAWPNVIGMSVEQRTAALQILALREEQGVLWGGGGDLPQRDVRLAATLAARADGSPDRASPP